MSNDVCVRLAASPDAAHRRSPLRSPQQPQPSYNRYALDSITSPAVRQSRPPRADRSAGTFNSAALYLLAFDPLARSLSIASRLEAQGPHQYLATNARRDRLYATTWADPPSLSAWSIDLGQSPHFEWLNTVPISTCDFADELTSTAATSSYVHWHDGYLYSAGGPSGEVHEIDKTTGKLGTRVQEMVYVSPEEFPTADKTRKALVRTEGLIVPDADSDTAVTASTSIRCDARSTSRICTFACLCGT